VGKFLIVMISTIAIRALANERRLQILEWLKNPTKHFPPQAEGDLAKDEVCGCLIARKLRISQPTTSEHMKILCQAGLTRSQANQEVDVLHARRSQRQANQESRSRESVGARKGGTPRLISRGTLHYVWRDNCDR
jgi:ArsR family transcriptional regulator